MNHSSESDVTFSYVIRILLSNFKKIITVVLIFSIFGYVYFNVLNTNFYSAKSIIQVGSNKLSLGSTKRTPIENLESLTDYLQLTFIDLENLIGNASLLSSISNQPLPDGSYLIILTSNNILKSKASSNVEFVFNQIKVRHDLKIKEYQFSIQNIIKDNEKELLQIQRDIAFLKKQTQLHETFQENVDKINFFGEDDFGFDKRLELENIFRISQDQLQTEAEISSKLDVAKDINLLLTANSAELEMPNFIDTKLYITAPLPLLSSSHNLIFNLITFAFAGFLISILGILFRHFYLKK